MNLGDQCNTIIMILLDSKLYLNKVLIKSVAMIQMISWHQPILKYTIEKSALIYLLFGCE